MENNKWKYEWAKTIWRHGRYALITIAERMRALQAGNIAFSETNVEWHKFQLRDNMQFFFTKAFEAASMEYIKTSGKFEIRYHKPVRTAYGELVQMVH
jgi:hypothetical protein